MTRTRELGAVHARTPAISAIDPRDLKVRSVTYYRAAASEPSETRVTLSLHSVTGRASRHWDPRLSARLARGAAVTPNQATFSSLSGKVLLEENADAGWRLILPGEAGQARQRWDGRGSHWTFEYDEQLRPSSVQESTPDTPPRIAERYTWGGAREHADNLSGRLVRHDDDAGSRLLHAYDLTHQVTDETRHFLATLDLPDWPTAMPERDALLEPGDGALTRSRNNPLGESLEQTDACGNRQRTAVNLAGELTGLELVLADGATHPLLVEARYNAFGQIERHTAGNGVVSHCEYDPANSRLTRRTASRPQRGLLQDLHYGHDPVGNVLHIQDRSQPTRHFANQKIEPVSTFAYDSLYQLIEASGREISDGASQGPALPDLEHLPVDTSRMTRYTQHYTYDPAGNLLCLRHVGNQPFTREYRIATDSNRSLPPELGPSRFADAFDANGNLRQLLRGQTMNWNPRNQLQDLDTVRRDGESDGEQYRYTGDGQRCRKTSIALASGRRLANEVRYLPGLEARRTATGEVLQVITCRTGLGEVRVLHWQEGKPEGIGNDQIRYNLADHLGSSALELDQNADLISQELYYPFGGTAWWAGRRAIEASYKTVRYSGKERDASGLYDYGFRYYAPWLQRWISPDPAGDVDGLNRYRFVAANPLSHQDANGLQKVEIDHVPAHDRVQAPTAMRARVSHADNRRINLPALDNHVFELAYDVTWSVKNLLFRGAGNQLGDILSSGLRSMTYTDRLRTLLGDNYTDRMTAEHALAAGTGLCDEFAAVSTFLAASSSRWRGNPVQLVQIPGHTFAALGDHREVSPLVVDPWVTYPIVHPLAHSKYIGRRIDFFDKTPRMPQDPDYALDQDWIDIVSIMHYAESPNTEMYPGLVESVRGDLNSGHDQSRWLWFQSSAMAQSQDVWYMDSGGNYLNGGLIPSGSAQRMAASVLRANAFLRSNPGLALKHL